MPRAFLIKKHTSPRKLGCSVSTHTDATCCYNQYYDPITLSPMPPSPPPAVAIQPREAFRGSSSPSPATPASSPVHGYSIAALLSSSPKKGTAAHWQHPLHGLPQPLQSARDFLRQECCPLVASPALLPSPGAFYGQPALTRPADSMLSPAPSSGSSDGGDVSPRREDPAEQDKASFPWEVKVSRLQVSVDFTRPTVRRNEPPRFNCEGCGKSYATFSGLSKHKRFHCTSEIKKEFSCKFCEKKYSSLGALKMHIRTHTLPCKCPLCGKAFSRPWLLQGHIRTHTGEKPFNCQHCSRAFADRSNLRAHLQTHTDIKKYNCKDCSKTFSRMSLLHKHEESCTVKPQTV